MSDNKQEQHEIEKVNQAQDLAAEQLPSSQYRFSETKEGATAFTINDPLVRLVFNKGSYMPQSEAFYSTPEGELLSFLEAVQVAAILHPELALQYAVWQRDPRLGKGNRSQSPWAIAAFAALPECVNHPRFAELVAKCIVRPDDAIQIVQAATLILGDNNLPLLLKQGIAQGLNNMKAYQMVKYANDRVNLLPEKREKNGRNRLRAPQVGQNETALAPKIAEKIPVRTLRLTDVLGICKNQLSPRLFKLYRYLHAPTRMQKDLLPLLEPDLPQLAAQKALRANPPASVAAVETWVQQALAARMTMEQMLSSTGMLSGQRKQLQALATATEQNPEVAAPISPLQQAELATLRIKGAIWQNIMAATVPDEDDPAKAVPFLGDVAFMRNIRGMHWAGVPVADLVTEAKRRRFKGIYPYQILSAAKQIKKGKAKIVKPTPAVLPVFDAIFERVAIDLLPRHTDGTLYQILGMADISGSMGIKLGSPKSSATCMDAALAFSGAFALTTRTPTFGGLAGTWADNFYPALARPDDSPLEIINKTEARNEGWGGTQVFGSILSLINWLSENPNVPRPEAVVILSDMQFHPGAVYSESDLKHVPQPLRKMIQRPEFKAIPPLAAALVLYRQILKAEVSVIIWNLATYEGAPVPSNMDRVLLMSGFDTNSFRIIERWLRAGSPGTALPNTPSGSGDNGSSFDTILTELHRY